MGFLSEAGVSALWNKVKANFGRSLETSGTTINLKNAAATPGTLGQVTLSAGDNVTITGNDSTKTITIEAADTTYNAATTSAAGLMSAADKVKLEGIEVGAEANQNAFTNIMAQGVAISADSPTDKLTFTAGANVTIVGDASADTITISATNTTYDSATTSKAGLMSVADKTKLDAITDSADAVSFTQSLTSGTKVGTLTINGSGVDLYAPTDTNTHYTSKNVVGSKANATVDTTTSLSNGNVFLNSVENNAVTSSHKITGSTGVTVIAGADGNITVKGTTYSEATTSKAGLMSAADKTKVDNMLTADDVNSAIASAQVGAAMYKGAVSSNSTISNSSYKAGWYWVVSTAGTYVGETCEVGDMIFANTDKGSAYSASHFDVVQNNIVEMTAAEVEAVCTL